MEKGPGRFDVDPLCVDLGEPPAHHAHAIARRDDDRRAIVVRHGRRVGTIAIARFCDGSLVGIYCVYTRPSFRGGGVMTDALQRIYAELEHRGLGLRLETSWTWQLAVRFYLRHGFWLHNWKHELSFVRRPRMPSPVIDISERQAEIAIQLDGKRVVLARARRDRRRLVSHDEVRDVPRPIEYLLWDARTTLALAVGLAGWPLVRSKYRWRLSRYSDGVHPEGLANQIVIWDAWAKHRAWRSDAPRIPGLEYPTWSELEARWAASDARYRLGREPAATGG